VSWHVRQGEEVAPVIARAAPVSLEELCQRLQRDADEERHRIARSLHDSSSQTLSAAAMSLSLVHAEAARLSETGQRALIEAQSLIADCSRELRDLSQSLHPPLLADAGLGPALRTLARRLGPGRLDLRVTDLSRFDSAVELAAYRFVEEAAAHVFSAPGPVSGRVEQGPDGILSICLDGPEGEVGLAVRQRVSGVGGRLLEQRTAGRLHLEAYFV
jgi:signal transduction histidine kinase